MQLWLWPGIAPLTLGRIYLSLAAMFPAGWVAVSASGPATLVRAGLRGEIGLAPFGRPEPVGRTCRCETQEGRR